MIGKSATAAITLLILATTFCGAQSPIQNDGKQAPINPKLRTIFVVGDSTANNHANGGLGWGDPFITYFDATKVNVLNRARGGRSSRTFITEGLWDKVLSEMKKGDFVLILLTKKHEVVHTFGWYMRKMIADTKAKGATPIVMSLTVRNIWKDGRVERGPGKYGEWAAEIAKSQKVSFIDVTKLIADRYEAMGEEKVKALFGPDHTHTSPAGAELNASLVIVGLRKLKGKPFDRHLLAKGKAVMP